MRRFPDIGLCIQTLIEIPDDSLASDWKYLVNAMHDDLMVQPGKALANLDALRKGLAYRGNARMWFVTSTDLQKQLSGSVTALAASLDELGAQAAVAALALALRLPVATTVLGLAVFGVVHNVLELRYVAGRFEAVASRKGGWKEWDVPVEIRRSSATIRAGHRFGDVGRAGE